MEATKGDGNEILECNKIMAQYAGIKAETEYCVGEPDGSFVYYSPKAAGFTEANQKAECERWLAEENQTQAKAVILTQEHYPSYQSDLTAIFSLVEFMEKKQNAKVRYDSHSIPGNCSVFIECGKYIVDIKDPDRHTAYYQALFKIIHKIVTKANY
jgi:hypothetical protein